MILTILLLFLCSLYHQNIYIHVNLTYINLLVHGTLFFFVFFLSFFLYKQTGEIEGISRIYAHRQVSKDCYLLVELVVSVGFDASAQCTLATTLKVDSNGLGNPMLGSIVDSMDLRVLFRF